MPQLYEVKQFKRVKDLEKLMEKLGEVGARVEKSPRQYLAWLAQEMVVFTTSAWYSTKLQNLASIWVNCASQTLWQKSWNKMTFVNWYHHDVRAEGKHPALDRLARSIVSCKCLLDLGLQYIPCLYPKCDYTILTLEYVVLWVHLGVLPRIFHSLKILCIFRQSFFLSYNDCNFGRIFSYLKNTQIWLVLWFKILSNFVRMCFFETE